MAKPSMSLETLALLKETPREEAETTLLAA